MQVAQVDGHVHLARNHVARPWVQVQAADGATGVRLLLMGDTVDRADHLGGPYQGVLAQVHRRGAGVGFNAGEGQVEPLLAEAAHDHANRGGLVFQHWPLLDMRLEIRAHRVAEHRTRTGIADALQFGAHRQALVVEFGEGVLHVELTGKHPGAHHAWRETRALFVGPHHHFDRRLRLQLQVIECADHFQPGHHPVAAVELAAGRLGVDMAAGHDRGQGGVTPGAACKDIPDGVDTDAAPGRLAPVHEQVAGLAVEVGERQAAHAAFDGGAELGEVHQRLPQAVAVDQRGVALEGVRKTVHVQSPVRHSGPGSGS